MKHFFNVKNRNVTVIFDGSRYSLYNASHILMGEDQSKHVEITRDIVRRIKFELPEAIYSAWWSEITSK